jgi:hypothetical protein
MRKTITLVRKGYVVKGVADLTLWGGGNSWIVMKPFTTNTLHKKILLSKINDNGFGVESINGAICQVHENFEGALRYFKTIYLGDISDNTLIGYSNLETLD